MAGSYGHCCNENNLFRFSLIDNMGDAHEACEEMFHMIRFLSAGSEARIEEAIKWANLQPAIAEEEEEGS